MRYIMKKKLSRYGNSLALIIDKAILELLHITEDTVLHLKTDGKELIITPEANENDKKQAKKKLISKDPKLQKIVEDIMEEYAEDFKKLADS